jgi:hypothetical protein
LARRFFLHILCSALVPSVHLTTELPEVRMRQRMPRVFIHLVLFIAVVAFRAPAQNIFLQPEDPHQQGQRRADDEVKNEIQAKLAEAPELKGLSISVKVESDRIILGGRIHNIAQKNKALAIAKASAEGREVIDDFEIIH